MARVFLPPVRVSWWLSLVLSVSWPYGCCMAAMPTRVIDLANAKDHHIDVELGGGSEASSSASVLNEGGGGEQMVMMMVGGDMGDLNMFQVDAASGPTEVGEMMMGSILSALFGSMSQEVHFKADIGIEGGGGGSFVPEEGKRQQFATYDLNADGVVTMEENLEVDRKEAENSGAPWDEPGSRASFKKTDLNNDGTVDLPEFLKFMSSSSSAESAIPSPRLAGDGGTDKLGADGEDDTRGGVRGEEGDKHGGGAGDAARGRRAIEIQVKPFQPSSGFLVFGGGGMRVAHTYNDIEEVGVEGATPWGPSTSGREGHFKEAQKDLPQNGAVEFEKKLKLARLETGYKVPRQEDCSYEAIARKNGWHREQVVKQGLGWRAQQDKMKHVNVSSEW